MSVTRLYHWLLETVLASSHSDNQSAQTQLSSVDSLSIDVLEDRMLLSSVVQADYFDDFEFGNPASDWQYLWNAPSDWSGVSSTNSTDQRFGDPQHYVALQTDGRSYRPAGDAAVDLDQPNRNLRLSKTGGRVGAGFQQTGDSNNRQSRYAIAAWTVQADGFYAIQESTLSTHASSKGIDVLIHINDEDPILRKRLAGLDSSFDINLGHLRAGDIVYVGLGGGSDDVGGTFRHDFSIASIDTPGITIHQTDGLTQVSEPGTSDTFSVVLNSRPTTGQRVAVDITVENPGELKTNVRRLFFNRSNWNIAQTVTVVGVDDSQNDGTTYTTITASIDPIRSNPEYLSVASQYFNAANFDDENLLPLSSQLGSGVVKGLSRIVITPGEYELDPINEIAAHQYVSWAEDVTIVADGVKVIANESNTGILIRESSNVTVKGLSIDYATLPFTQGTVTEVAEDGSWIDVRIHDGYELPTDVVSTRAIIHDPNTLRVKPKTASRHGATLSAIDGRNFRINSFVAYDALKSGDYVSLTLPINTPHAIWIDRGENVRLEDVTVNASTSFAFFETQGSGNEYYNLKVTPGDRPAGATVDRLLSSNYDGFHSKNTEIGPKVFDSVVTS